MWEARIVYTAAYAEWTEMDGLEQRSLHYTSSHARQMVIYEEQQGGVASYAIVESVDEDEVTPSLLPLLRDGAAAFVCDQCAQWTAPVRMHSTPGFTGAPIYVTDMTCGCTVVDASADNIEAAR